MWLYAFVFFPPISRELAFLLHRADEEKKYCGNTSNMHRFLIFCLLSAYFECGHVGWSWPSVSVSLGVVFRERKRRETNTFHLFLLHQKLTRRPLFVTGGGSDENINRISSISCSKHCICEKTQNLRNVLRCVGCDFPARPWLEIK